MGTVGTTYIPGCTGCVCKVCKVLQIYSPLSHSEFPEPIMLLMVDLRAPMAHGACSYQTSGILIYRSNRSPSNFCDRIGPHSCPCPHNQIHSLGSEAQYMHASMPGVSGPLVPNSQLSQPYIYIYWAFSPHRSGPLMKIVILHSTDFVICRI